MCYIGHGALVTHKVLGASVLEVFVQYAIQPPGLVLVTADAVGDLLWCVSEEMVCLSLHRSNPGIQKEEPVVDLVAFTGAFGIGDLMFRVVLLNQVLHDATGLKKTNCSAVGERICQSRDSSIGIDLEEPWFLLRVFGDVDRMGPIGDPVRDQWRVAGHGKW